MVSVAFSLRKSGTRLREAKIDYWFFFLEEPEPALLLLLTLAAALALLLLLALTAALALLAGLLLGLAVAAVRAAGVTAGHCYTQEGDFYWGGRIQNKRRRSPKGDTGLGAAGGAGYHDDNNNDNPYSLSSS